jgi:general secretion pathway protein G
MKFRNSKGFTLIELLIVVAIIGIIAVIAIPQLLNAIDRGKQKRTMADMRSVGTALGTYQVDNSQFVVGGLSVLETQLETGGYMGVVPMTDGWNNGYTYTGAISSYSLSSGGKDGGTDHSTDNNFDKYDFNHTITLSNGVFTAAPASN